MKTKFLSLLILALFLFSGQFAENAWAQKQQSERDSGDSSNSNMPGDEGNQEKEEEEEGFGGDVFAGGIVVDGKNYQQFGIRTDLPIGKFGFGLDIQLLIDENGQIRKEDWDEWTDYLDKIYYIRYGFKGDPFYIKTGGLDYSYLGYENIINGYTNMLEFPTVKRYGLETEINIKKVGVELFLNDFKEILGPYKSALIGGRASYKIIGDLAIGATVVTDMNEYAGLKDFDEDGIPDEIDEYPDNKKWGTSLDKWNEEIQSEGLDEEEINLVRQVNQNMGLLSTVAGDDLFNIHDNKSSSMVYSLDIGYPILNLDNAKMDIYAAFTKIHNHGWGMSAPGFRFKLGKNNFMSFRAEYRRSSDEFLFGYYNHTYDLERSNFYQKDNGTLGVMTKSEMLNGLQSELNGFFVGLTMNIFGYVGVVANYQDLMNGSIHQRSMKGEVNLLKTLIPKIDIAKAYYVQNNVQDFREWKTPSTVMGYSLGYEVKGAILAFDYRYTFQDLDGSGSINGDAETMKTIGFKTSVKF